MSETVEALRSLRRETLTVQRTKFGHDFAMLGKIDMKDWANGWIADLVRANDQSAEYRTIFVGIGKTARLLRLRSNLRQLDEGARRKISNKYKKSRSRVIILDNEVSVPSL